MYTGNTGVPMILELVGNSGNIGINTKKESINVLNNEKNVLMTICKISDNDNLYEIIKQILDGNTDISFMDNNNNTVFDNLIFDGHKNPKTIKLLVEYTLENQKTENNVINVKENVIDWKQKYLNLLTDKKITLPPLTEDSYDYMIEFERVASYNHWNNFLKTDIVNAKILDLRQLYLKELPKEIGNLINLQELILSYNYLSDLPEEISKLENLENLYIGSNKLKEIPKYIYSFGKCVILLL